MIKFISFFIALSLAGCSFRPGKDERVLTKEKSFSSQNSQKYTLEFSTNHLQRYDRDDGSTIFATRWGKMDENDYSIEIFDNKTLLSPTPCLPDLTGASQMRVIAQNPDILVGTVDAWDRYHMDWPNQQEPLCKLPPWPKEKPFECPTQEEIAADPMGTESQILGLDCQERWRAYEKEHGLRAGYALCSQRGDKTVVICLQQMKDDPKQAEEIFSTFRWIEE